MRTLARNRQEMKYSLQGAATPIYQKDASGNTVYVTISGQQVPVETGETKISYSKPKTFYASISMSGGDSKEAVYGIDLGSYDATIIVPNGYVPLVESSLIWFESEPTYLDIEDVHVNPLSADYKVVKVIPNLNFTKYALKKVVKVADED